MTTMWWVLLIVGAWSVVALAVGSLVGRAIRQRDRQTPRPDESENGRS